MLRVLGFDIALNYLQVELDIEPTHQKTAHHSGPDLAPMNRETTRHLASYSGGTGLDPGLRFAPETDQIASMGRYT